MKRTRNRGFVVCINNEGYEASLELRKIYRRLADAKAEARGLIRVIDESGEDYLFPTDCFAPIELPSSLRRAFSAAS
jgi:hypothetical protein